MLGSFLYSVGGFSLPFHVVGSLTTGLSLALLFVVPNIKANNNKEDEEQNTLIHNHGAKEQDKKERADRKPLSLSAVAMVWIT